MSSLGRLVVRDSSRIKNSSARMSKRIELHCMLHQSLASLILNASRSLPGLLEGTALLRVNLSCFLYVPATNPYQTPEREQEELDQYDAKVYRACKAMVESQTSSLKVLGVPFFGVKPYLVVNTPDKPSETTESRSVQSDGKVTREQLLDLQRKMLNHLMELYGD